MLQEKGFVIIVMRKKRTEAVVRKMLYEKGSRGVLPVSLHLEQWNALKVKTRGKKTEYKA